MSASLPRIAALQLAIFGLTLWNTPVTASRPAFWTLEVSSGTAYNVPLALRIEQVGETELKMTAHYATRPLRASPYYAARLGRGSQQGGWEAEFIHHKLYLQNTTAEVPNLEATHGYNYLLLNRSMRRLGLLWRVGLGVVVVHLEGTVRAQPILVRGGVLGTSYRLTGPAAQLGVGKPIGLGHHAFVSPEIKLTGAHARIPIEGGRVIIPNVALHGVVGVGYAF